MDKARLLAGYLPEEDVMLPSGLGEVRVRGLSRNEAVAVQKDVDPDDNTTLEIRACAFGMLDPVLTREEVAAWRDVALAADVQAVAQTISRLSNMDPAGGKRAYLELEADPSLELEMFIAQKLGRTVTELRQSMGQDEFVRWTRYYARKAQREELDRLMAGGT